MTLNLLTLKFSGVASPFEAPFLRDYYEVSLPQIRIAALLAAVFYAAFGHLDAVLYARTKVHHMAHSFYHCLSRVLRHFSDIVLTVL